MDFVYLNYIVFNVFFVLFVTYIRSLYNKSYIKLKNLYV